MRWPMSIRIFAAAATMFIAATPVFAEVVEAPGLTVDVPATFEAKKVTRGVQAKTPDGEVYVWFETYTPEEKDALVKEHDEYWTKSGVAIGGDVNRSEKTIGNMTVIASDYKGATWKGKPTVLRYLFIDPAQPSKKLILMSLWASPEGDTAHDGEIMSMIGSMKLAE